MCIPGMVKISRCLGTNLRDTSYVSFTSPAAYNPQMAANQIDVEDTVSDDPHLEIGYPMLIKAERKATEYSQKSLRPSEIAGRMLTMADGRERKKRTHFTLVDDMAILDLVIQWNPFLDHSKWISIAELLKRKRMKGVTVRNIRERVLYLINTFRSKKSVHRSGRVDLSNLEKKLKAVSSLKAYAEKNPNLIIKKRKGLTRAGIQATCPDKDSRLHAAQAQADHGYTSKVVNNDHEEEVLEDVEDPELKFMMTSEATEIVPDCILTGDSVATPAEPSQSLPSPIPDATLTPSAPVANRPPLTLEVNSNQLPQKEMKFRILTVHKSSADVNVWEKLKNEQEYKSKVLTLEMLKEENEKRRLDAEEAKAKMNYELETKRIKLNEQKLTLMRECLEQNRKLNDAMLSLMETMVIKSVLSE